MSILRGSRTRLDSIIYWAVFTFIALFITYFLNSMIVLANADDMSDTSTTLASYNHQRHLLRHEQELKAAGVEVEDVTSSSDDEDDD